MSIYLWASERGSQGEGGEIGVVGFLLIITGLFSLANDGWPLIMEVIISIVFLLIYSLLGSPCLSGVLTLDKRVAYIEMA